MSDSVAIAFSRFGDDSQQSVEDAHSPGNSSLVRVTVAWGCWKGGGGRWKRKKEVEVGEGRGRRKGREEGKEGEEWGVGEEKGGR